MVIMNVGLLEIILFVIFFQILSLTPFLLFSGNKKGISNKVLAIFLLSKAICISNFISFRLYSFFYENFPHLFFVGSSFTILWGPGVYFYTKSLVKSDFKFFKKDLFHLIPFSIHFLYLLFSYHIYDADTKRQLLTQQAVFTTETYSLIMGIIHLLILFYVIASFKLIYKYRQDIKNSFASIEKINLSWMVFVLVGFSVKWIGDLWLYIYEIIGFPTDFLKIGTLILLFLFINIMIYKGLKQPEIFSGIIESQPEKKAFLSKNTQQEYLSKLTSFMENDKPFLDPDLTLMDLAEKVSIPYRALSEVINNSLNKNFYDFINEYRIKESQRLLLEKNSKFSTVLEVLYEVGYNSKSSFNNAFKKYTGMTPTEFKRLSEIGA